MLLGTVAGAGIETALRLKVTEGVAPLPQAVATVSGMPGSLAEAFAWGHSINHQACRDLAARMHAQQTRDLGMQENEPAPPVASLLPHALPPAIGSTPASTSLPFGAAVVATALDADAAVPRPGTAAAPATGLRDSVAAAAGVAQDGPASQLQWFVDIAAAGTAQPHAEVCVRRRIGARHVFTVLCVNDAEQIAILGRRVRLGDFGHRHCFVLVPLGCLPQDKLTKKRRRQQMFQELPALDARGRFTVESFEAAHFERPPNGTREEAHLIRKGQGGSLQGLVCNGVRLAPPQPKARFSRTPEHPEHRPHGCTQSIHSAPESRAVSPLSHPNAHAACSGRGTPRALQAMASLLIERVSHYTKTTGGAHPWYVLAHEAAVALDNPSVSQVDAGTGEESASSLGALRKIAVSARSVLAADTRAEVAVEGSVALLTLLKATVGEGEKAALGARMLRFARKQLPRRRGQVSASSQRESRSATAASHTQAPASGRLAASEAPPAMLECNGAWQHPASPSWGKKRCLCGLRLDNARSRAKFESSRRGKPSKACARASKECAAVD